MPEIEMNGIYQHYKGGLYKVTGLARHHETGQFWVIYTSSDGTWVRPLIEFTGYKKGHIKRFEYVGPGGR